MKQNPQAHDFVRDSNLVWFDDLIADVADNMGGFSNALSEYVFY